MTEEEDLKALNSAMRAATPTPDAARRAQNIALAQKNFADIQGSRDATRLTSERPKLGWRRGVDLMLETLNPRALLGATTALVAVGLVMTLPELTDRGPVTVQPAPEPLVIAEEEAIASAERPEAPQPVIEREERSDDLSGRGAGATYLETAPPGSSDRKDDQTSLRGEVARARAQQSVQTADAEVLPAPSPAPVTAAADAMVRPEGQSEAFPEVSPNALMITAEDPISTFSIDVDTASYAIVRSSLMAGQLPPVGAVRIEEMVNYFPYEYPAPDAGTAPFRPTLRVTQTPWNPDTQLLHVAIQGEMPLVEDRPPLNLVFLVDTSGSMQATNKLPLLKQSLSLLLAELRPADQVAIVAYAGNAGQVLAPTAASDRERILSALDGLEAGGSTAGEAGLQLAYSLADQMSQADEVSRVILATDGDFNVGLSDPDALERYIAEQREGGTYLSVLGFGRGNLDDRTMQALAQNGNGQAAYIDTLSEAQKVLSDQFTGALFPIANDVKIQVEFNPAEIAEYRLIGYETRVLNRADFNNDQLDAGDIGAGHTVTALYEITPVGSPARLSDPLRYQPEEPMVSTGELGYFKLRYKVPGEDESQLIERPFRASSGEADDDMRFAMAIAGFGQLLRGSDYLGDWGYDAAIALAIAAKGEDAFGYRAEAVRLMRLAQSLSK